MHGGRVKNAAMPPASPVPSSTVVLIRDGSHGLETLLLVRRARGSDPFSGASVFPGGVLDASDSDPALAPPACGFDAERARRELGEILPDDTVRALWVAACRELFEEAGILLARDRDGRPVSPAQVRRLAPERDRLQSGEGTFREILDRERLVLALDRLLPHAHWITPETQPKRWDTRFFLAAAPAGQAADSDGTETTTATWFRPADALAAYRDGLHVLAPPTFRELEALEPFHTVEDALESSRRAGAPATILPVPLPGETVPTLVYPGDRDYPGEGRGPGLNRLRMHDGRWRSFRD